MKSKAESQKSKLGSREADSAAPETLPLLLEVGCEEIPARFLADAQTQLGEKIRADLLANRLLATPDGRPIYAKDEAPISPVQTYSTPRRLVAFLPAVLRCQPDVVQTIEGPPVKVAVDAEGGYTRAAEGFAARNAANLSDLKRVTTARGEYLVLQKSEPGRPAVDVLGDRATGGFITPGLLTMLLWNWDLSAVKSMYWEKARAGADFRFIRPIRWLLALLGEGQRAQVIKFWVPGAASGNLTYGHRLYAHRPIRVTGFSDYQKKMRAARAEIDPARRRETVQRELKASLEGLKLRPVADPWLEDWVVNSTEWPRAIAGEFESKFLDLPREILITVMRDHQKYFAVEDSSSQLQPRFVTFLNREDDPQGMIRAGHERVLRARFTDAQFFWDTDQKIPLRDRMPMLEKVTYHEKLGSYADKVRRMEAIALAICDQPGVGNHRRDMIVRAVRLCKCDLTTVIVHEFPELQGVAGALYLKAQEDAPFLWRAVYDHYRPLGYRDRSPKEREGAIVSLADRIDNIVSGFAVGNQPSGSSDPFGLRRDGNAIIKIIHDHVLPIDLDRLVRHAARPFQGVTDCDRLVKDVGAFMKDRLRGYLEDVHKLQYDTVRAVLETTRADTPLDAYLRATALEEIRSSYPADFEALSQGAKRVRNILAKSAAAGDLGRKAVEEALLSEGAERELYAASRTLGNKMEGWAQDASYEEAFTAFATLRPLVDRFFDEVLVMAEDEAVRRNRLRLLTVLNREVFSRFADLSQIESNASTSVGAPTSENNKQPAAERGAAIHGQKGR